MSVIVFLIEVVYSLTVPFSLRGGNMMATTVKAIGRMEVLLTFTSLCVTTSRTGLAVNVSSVEVSLNSIRLTIRTPPCLQWLLSIF